MTRQTSRAAKRTLRQRAKLLEAAISAIALGFALLILPRLVHTGMLVGLAGALATPGWICIGLGAVLFGVHRATSSIAGGLSPAPVPAQPRPPTDTGHSPATQTHIAQGDGSSPPQTPSEWTVSVFDVIEWRRFEAVCEKLFAQARFETRSQSHGADGGIDIWLYSRNHAGGPVSVVQCKRWSAKPVGVSELRALLGSMADKKVARGIFATTSTFTADAAQFARSNKIQLIDRAGILALIKTRTPAEQAELLEVATEGEFWVPTCASCGVKLLRRSSKSGAKAFWGCTNFPRCRTTMTNSV